MGHDTDIVDIQVGLVWIWNRGSDEDMETVIEKAIANEVRAMLPNRNQEVRDFIAAGIREGVDDIIANMD